MSAPTEDTLRAPWAASETFPLDQASRLQKVQVVGINSKAGSRLLASLGLREGQTLQVRRVAPLGGPLLLESGGATIALGRSLARHILVRVLT